MADWTRGYTSELPYVLVHIPDQSPQVIDFSLLRNGIMPPRKREGMAYCELGCGHGYTSNILAACYPDMTFHAVDFNPAQIAEGREMAEEAGLENINFHDLSFEEFLDRDDIPQFDYITLNGIWSWVSEDVREQIKTIIGKKLVAGGAAFVSYNAQPGRASAGPLQRLYLELHNFMPGKEAARIENLIGFTDSFAAHKPKFFEHHPVVQALHERARAGSPNYFAHEFLNENWTAWLFMDVCKDLDQARLSFAASTDIAGLTLTADFEKKYKDILSQISDPIMQEQLKDFVVDAKFRRDIFVRGPRRLGGIELVERLNATRLTLLGPADSFSNRIESDSQIVVLDEKRHAAMLKALEDGPRTIGALQEDKGLQGLALSELLNLVCCAMFKGQIAALRAPEEIGDPEPAKRLNAAILKRTKTGGEYHWLASPEIGFGIKCNTLERIFFQAIKDGEDPIVEAINTCKLINQKITRDGKPVSSADEAVKVLKEASDKFAKTRLKYLQAAGIAA